jgi:hypothetical protein
MRFRNRLSLAFLTLGALAACTIPAATRPPGAATPDLAETGLWRQAVGTATALRLTAQAPLQPSATPAPASPAEAPAVTPPEPPSTYAPVTITLAWAPDGRYVAFSDGRMTGRGSGTGVVDYQIFLAPRDGSGRRLFVAAGCNPNWGP